MKALCLFISLCVVTTVHATGVDSVAEGEELYNTVSAQLKKLRKALRKENALESVGFALLEQQIKDLNIRAAIEILKGYQNQGGKTVAKLARRIRKKLVKFRNDQNADTTPPLTGMTWSPVAAGTVGVDLLLDGVNGTLEGDVIAYQWIRGSCYFGSGTRMLTFTDVGTCVVKATVARTGYVSWDSGEQSIVVGAGTITNIVWTPATGGTVGVDLTLDAVVGTQNGDVPSYTKVSGPCRFVSGSRTLTFTDVGTCVVQARVERQGYFPWDSATKSIAIDAGTLTGISWTPAIGGTVGVDLVLDAVSGTQNGDVVTYSQVRGACQLGGGRTVSFSGVGDCVIRAQVVRRGYHPWVSGDKTITVGEGSLSGMSWNPALGGIVGEDLVLDGVSGNQGGDTVRYIKISGPCDFSVGTTLTFSDAGTCVVKATVERRGYQSWDSGDKSISVALGTLSSIGWTPATGGVMGVDLVLDEVSGALASDVVDYRKVSGPCDFSVGTTLTFSDAGTCVVKATVERRGYHPWDSGDKSIGIGLGTLSGMSWALSAEGVVGVDLVLDEVSGILASDGVNYVKVGGPCHFSSGTTLAFSGAGTCVVKATVARQGYHTWSSPEQSIPVVLPSLKGIRWNPTDSGIVGTTLVLDEVVGSQNGDVITYVKTVGNCGLSGRSLSLNGEGACGVRATVERSGFAPWDSGERFVMVIPPHLQGIAWTAASTSATVGDSLLLDSVSGTQLGDRISYQKTLGNCGFGSGNLQAERTLTFSSEGMCVVRAKVERSGYSPWYSGDISVAVSAASISLPCGGTTPGGKRFFSTDTAFALIQENGSVITWGDPNYGGDSSQAPSSALDSNVVKIYSNVGAFAALKSDGTVVTWGHSGYGGNSSSVSGGALNSGVKVCEIVSSERAFAALKEDGSVVAWGDSLYGGKLSVMKFYYRVPNWEGFPLHPSLYSGGVSKIVGGGGAFTALKDDGSIFSWGNERRGGDHAIISEGGGWVYDVKPMIRENGFVDVYSNAHAFVAIREETVNGQKVRSALAWGDIRYGGRAPLEDLSSGVDKIFSNDVVFAALKEDGSVVAWGDAGRGGWIDPPVVSKLQSGVVEIFSNKFTFVALKDDHSLVSWGHRYNVNANYLVPFPESSLQSGVKRVFSTGLAFAALMEDGSVVTWGSRWAGGGGDELGNVLDGGVIDLASTGYTFAALKSDGSVIVWGSYYGALPKTIIDTNCLASRVFRLGGSTKKAYVALRDDGTVVVWGDFLAGGLLSYGGNGTELEKCDIR